MEVSGMRKNIMVELVRRSWGVDSRRYVEMEVSEDAQEYFGWVDT